MATKRRAKWWWSIAAVALVNCLFQMWWFSERSLHEIDFDGMAYVGIARHIVDGHFHDSINAFRSPLLSWGIAAVASSGSDFVLIGKILTMLSALACAALVFAFTYALWQSLVAAAVAMLWFSFARGIFPLSTAFVSPDLLFTALVLTYFLVLVRCFRGGGKLAWSTLGAVHALAYLAKSFALPWLAVSTLFAVAFAFPRSQWKKALASLSLAACIPIFVALIWGLSLQSRYGIFTTGSQLRANLLQWTLAVRLDPHDQGYEVLRETAPFTDRYSVVDPLPPGSPGWKYPIHLRELMPAVVRTEARNLPSAIKELLFVLTLGGVLAFLLGLYALFRNRVKFPVEFGIVTLAAIDAIILVLAYCGLVFDGRYLFPILPILMGSAAPFFVWKSTPERELALPSFVRCVCLAMLIGGLAWTVLYRSSPYRTVRRDYQNSCYLAGGMLKQSGAPAVISFGSGPYPEHGVGWEAAFKSAFFADSQLTAATFELPTASHDAAALHDIVRSQSSAVLVWGPAGNANFQSLVAAIEAQCHGFRSIPIRDPVAGQVGILFAKPDAGSSYSLNGPGDRLCQGQPGMP